jgi:hypothetical protein
VPTESHQHVTHLDRCGRASRRRRSATTKWEYLEAVATHGDLSGEEWTDSEGRERAEPLADSFNARGSEGWRLVAAYPESARGFVRFIFVRPAGQTGHP